jgi:hypothetical protein
VQEKLHEALKYLHVLKKRIKIDHKPSSNSRSNHQDRKTSASRVQVRASPCKTVQAVQGTLWDCLHNTKSPHCTAPLPPLHCARTNVPALPLRAHGERRLRCHQHFTVATTSHTAHSSCNIGSYTSRVIQHFAPAAQVQYTEEGHIAFNVRAQQRIASAASSAGAPRSRTKGARVWAAGRARRTRRRGRQERRRVLDGHGA